MKFLRRFGLVGCLVLVLQGGCASELPALPNEGTSSGEGDSAGAESTVALDTSGGELEDPPAMPVLSLSFSQVKRFDFTWAAVQGAEHYQVLESSEPGAEYVQLGGDVVGETVSFEMPLHFRWQASYVLRACNAAGCTDSAAVDVVGSLAEAVGYVKGSNTGADDNFGHSVALSGDGNTLAVSAIYEDSNARGIGDDQAQANDSVEDSGAVYVFVKNGAGTWSQQAYIKASNTGTLDRFGQGVALSGDGNTLAVGANGEDSSTKTIEGDQDDDSAEDSGAVYVFVRDGIGTWSQQAYIKASNTETGDLFGNGVALAGDGNTLAVGVVYEDSNGIGGPNNNSFPESGAVCVFVRDGAGVWSQQAYVKASNTGASDSFGVSVALSGDGDTLAVGAWGEDNDATGIGDNDADNNSAVDSGAVYVFVRDGVGVWLQQAYVKASNTEMSDVFGHSVALSGDGNTLAVGAIYEDSNATGIGSKNQMDNSVVDSGAVYVFVRDGAGAWSQQAYVKASNTAVSDNFGVSVALAGDGNILAVGAFQEDSTATGIDGDQTDDSVVDSGAVYVFTRNGAGAWSQPTYVKASNPGVSDNFGYSVALAGDGNTLAVGARLEASNAIDIGENPMDDSASGSGAAYLY